MTRIASMQHSAVATALSLLDFDPTHEHRLRSTRELTRACRELDVDCADEGADYADHQIAADCAAVLEKLAARYRRAERALLGVA